MIRMAQKSLCHTFTHFTTFNSRQASFESNHCSKTRSFTTKELFIIMIYHSKPFALTVPHVDGHI